MRKFIYLFFMILCTLLVVLLLNSPYKFYSIILFSLAVLFFILFIISFLRRDSSDIGIFNRKLKRILNTYDSILVKSDNHINLGNRTPIVLNSFNDLVNAQMEVRKPISYYLENECCNFILFDDKEVYIYVLKVNDNSNSVILQDLAFEYNNQENKYSNLFDSIDNTTIVMVGNSKSFKVSPIRKKKSKKVDDDIEIL